MLKQPPVITPVSPLHTDTHARTSVSTCRSRDPEGLYISDLFFRVNYLLIGYEYFHREGGKSKFFFWNHGRFFFFPNLLTGSKRINQSHPHPSPTTTTTTTCLHHLLSRPGASHYRHARVTAAITRDWSDCLYPLWLFCGASPKCRSSKGAAMCSSPPCASIPQSISPARGIIHDLSLNRMVK